MKRLHTTVEEYNMRATSYNRVYLASCLRHSAQILLRRTSDTLGTLAAICMRL